MVRMVGTEEFGTRWKRAFGTFMINRPTLSCRHWREFVYTECSHDIILDLHVCASNFESSTTQRHLSLLFCTITSS